MFGKESSPLKSLMGTNVPGNEASWERKFQVTKVPELSFLGTKVLWYESSSYHFCDSAVQKCSGTFFMDHGVLT